MNDILRSYVVPHFETYSFSSPPLYIGNTGRPHRTRAVSEYLENNAINVIAWSAISPDSNPKEHGWLVDWLDGLWKLRPEDQNVSQNNN